MSDLIRDETDRRIPSGLNTDQEKRFVEIFNNALANDFREEEAIGMALEGLETPEDRMPEGETEIQGPEKG